MRLSSRPLPRRLILVALILGGPACSLPTGLPGAAPTATAVPPTPSPTPTVAPTATPAARAGAGGRLEVDALGVSQRPEGFVGGTLKVQVTVEKNTGTELWVGFFEERAGGIGRMSHASSWMAVITTSFLLGIDPTEYRYSYAESGYTDGPSAGALMTVATLAAILGHPLKDDATMTGTINPDGTIGPVGGIPQKIEGAAAAKTKKTLVLIPAGQRQAQDRNKKKNVDVIAQGQSQGIEVREVATISQAYELLTGAALPKPAGRVDGLPALSGETADRVRAKTKDWLARYEPLKEQYQTLLAQQPAGSDNPIRELDEEWYRRVLDEAKTAAGKAATYEQQGQVSAAYSKAVAATTTAAVAFYGLRATDAYLNGGMSGVNRHLSPIKPTMKAEAMLERLSRQTPATLGDVVTLADAYGNLGLALGLIEWGDRLLKEMPARSPQGVLRVYAATLMYAFADHAVAMAADALDLGLGVGSAPAPELEKVQRLSELFQRAAEANLNYVQAVVLRQEESPRGEIFLATYDTAYLLAVASWQATEAMKKRTRGDTATTYAGLGGALRSYVLSSLLVAKYYSLDVEYNDDGTIKGIENEPSLAAMLDFAERRAQEITGLAQTASGGAVQPLINFEGARAGRAGTLEDKFDALQGYWTAALQGQIIGMLSGAARVSR